MSTIATYIRDAAYNRLLTIAPWKSTRRTPIPTLQADMLPALGVFLLRETMNPDGDSNNGPPRYISDAVIAFTVTAASSTPDVLDTDVDALVDLIEDTLLCDGTFIDLRDAENKPILDSIPTISRTFNFPRDGETYFLECRVQMTFRFYCYFAPRTPNLLRKVSVDVRPFNDPVTVADKFEIDLTG